MSCCTLPKTLSSDTSFTRIHKSLFAYVYIYIYIYIYISIIVIRVALNIDSHQSLNNQPERATAYFNCLRSDADIVVIFKNSLIERIFTELDLTYYYVTDNEF